MIFWFCFTCIKISARQTITSRSLTSILNLACTYGVTCSYDVVMRRWRRRWEPLALIWVLNHLPNVNFVQIFSYNGYLGLRLTHPSIVVSLNYSRPTLNLQRYVRNCVIGVCEQQRHRQACTSAQADQRRRSLISAFAIHLLNSIILKLAPSEISLFCLVSVAEKAGFGIIFSETLKTGFVASMLIYIHVNADPIHKPGSCDMNIEGALPL